MYDDPDEPRDRDARRRANPFGDIDEMFRNLGIDPNDFERMFRDMQKSMMDAMRHGSPFEPGKPFVTGFSFKMGEDGRPHIEHFGDRAKKSTGEMKLSGEREPLTDVMSDPNSITVTMEIPGVQKSDINLEANADALEISVDTESRKYHKIVKLPGKVKPETTKATYNNGILDVVMQRAEVGGGVKVQVE